MLPQAHLTSYSRVSGSRWMITSSWLSRSLRSVLYNSSVYSCHLFLISPVSVRSLPFLSFIVPILAWNVPLISLIFLTSSLVFYHSVVFLYSFALFTEEGLLIPLYCYLELCIQLGISFPFSLAFCFSSFLSWASLVARTVKHLRIMRETRVWSPGWEDPLEKEMATHSSILAWKIPWTEDPGRL